MFFLVVVVVVATAKSVYGGLYSSTQFTGSVYTM